jgi:hypothetical protein
VNDEVCISGLYACFKVGEKAFGKCLILSSMGLENIGHAFLLLETVLAHQILRIDRLVVLWQLTNGEVLGWI